MQLGKVLIFKWKMGKYCDCSADGELYYREKASHDSEKQPKFRAWSVKSELESESMKNQGSFAVRNVDSE